MLSELLQQYGYIVVFVAGLFEGETILMLGAFAVHQGYLSLGPLIACGAAAAFLTDQFYFHLGRRKGAELLAGRPGLRASIRSWVMKIIVLFTSPWSGGPRPACRGGSGGRAR